MNSEFKFMVIIITLGVIVCICFQKASDQLKAHLQAQQEIEQLIK
tara:strand:+ start:2533 stop:2667 length:135 start_codon:yes stop_codon:yes gene_type:complete